MKYPRYPVTVSNDRRSFEFFSEGPRGKIKKTIVYTRIGPGLYNLAFGDWNKEKRALDDSNRTNNGDRDMVLATVAHTALDFFKLFPKAKLFIEGSTYSRTRLYQMGINANFAEITEKFEIQGFVDECWEPFIHSCNYEAFLISMVSPRRPSYCLFKKSDLYPYNSTRHAIIGQRTQTECGRVIGQIKTSLSTG